MLRPHRRCASGPDAQLHIGNNRWGSGPVRNQRKPKEEEAVQGDIAWSPDIPHAQSSYHQPSLRGFRCGLADGVCSFRGRCRLRSAARPGANCVPLRARKTSRRAGHQRRACGQERPTKMKDKEAVQASGGQSLSLRGETPPAVTEPGESRKKREKPKEGEGRGGRRGEGVPPLRPEAILALLCTNAACAFLSLVRVIGAICCYYVLLRNLRNLWLP